ncbi:MAG TPA: hypothetical protein VIG74_06980, partial [Alphaproteobacteria bacterium]
MQWTFSKYRIAYPFMDEWTPAKDASEARRALLPDQIFDTLIEEVLPAFKAARISERARPALQEVEGRKNRIVISSPPGSVPETIAQVFAVLRRLDDGVADSFARAAGRGWIDFTAASAPGLAEGSCDPTDKRHDGRPATITLKCDGTINDPIYLAHEAGHFADNAASPKFDYNTTCTHKLGRCRQEVQAFFTQHAFYDPALHPEWPPERKSALRQHLLAESHISMRNLANDLHLLEIAQGMSEEQRHSKAGFTKYEAAYTALHAEYYRPAFFIAAGLYELFKEMPVEQKKDFLNIFYRTGDGGAEMGDILNAA